MQRRNFLKSIGLLSASATIPASTIIANPGSADLVIEGKVTSNGKGISNVVVSDGFNVVATGKDGRYRFTPHPSAEFVFVSVPSGYAIPNRNGIAIFYTAIIKDGKTQKADFALDKLPVNDDKHAFIVWGDTQIESKGDAEQLKTKSAPDTKAVIDSLGSLPVHGIGCGDLVFDDPALYDDYKQAVAATGIPFFQIVGNHDIDYTARTDEGSQNTFKSHFGPNYYSFNRGQLHYIFLDNVFFIGAEHSYIGYVTETQLKWMEKDLQYVPAGSTVIVSLHIPTNNGEKRRNGTDGESIRGVTANRNALYALLKNYTVHFMSGHTHFNENWEMGNMMEHNHGTVCGAWWTGPVCGDGTPNGYAIYEVDGTNLKWYYKCTGYDKNHQMTLYKRGHVDGRPLAILANVWNCDPKWTIEWAEDGVNKGAMEQITAYDPEAFKLYKGPAIPARHKWVEPNMTDHLFTAVPSANAKKITVRATDRFGNQYSDTLDL
jgi:hypothetical protein